MVRICPVTNADADEQNKQGGAEQVVGRPHPPQGDAGDDPGLELGITEK